MFCFNFVGHLLLERITHYALNSAPWQGIRDPVLAPRNGKSAGGQCKAAIRRFALMKGHVCDFRCPALITSRGRWRNECRLSRIFGASAG